MFGTARRTRSLVAAAGAAAGVATVMAAPTGASAQEASDQQPDLVFEELPAGAIPSAPAAAPDSHGTCLSRTDFVASNGRRYFLPTTGNNNFQFHCILVPGNHTPGVGKLQDALNRCNNRESIAVDNAYGPQTTAAVQRAQRRYGIDDDGRYGPVTRNNLFWPGFDGNNVHRNCTRFSFNP